MAATAAQVAELRRMVNEPDADPYTDDVLETYIERYRAIDELGTKPMEASYTTEPPTLTENDSWIPTYDLHAAAADIWQEKSATVAEDYRISADGGTLSREQVQSQYLKQARYHLSRRKA
ncbi:unnamed protein product, partial [marine sediment metagenome]